ncbi:MAG: lysostaphin resistance A-like protein [Inquilinaceae bacterium]
MTLLPTEDDRDNRPHEPIRHYLDLGRDGKASHGRYAVGLLIVILGGTLAGLVIGASVGIAWRFADGGPFFPPLLVYAAINVIFACFLAMQWLVIRKIHRRPLRSLITGAQRVSMARIVTGVVLFGVATLVAEIIVLGIAVAFGGWEVLPRLAYLDADFFWLIPLALVLTPIQTTAEELLFRGYLAQWIGRGVHRPWLLCLIIGLLFGMVHLANPEMAFGPVPVGLTYVGMGILLMAVSIRDGTTELAIGAHAINNLLFVLLIHSDGGSLPSPGLWMADHVTDGKLIFVGFVIQATVFLVGLRLFDRMTKRPPAPRRSGRQVPSTEADPDATLSTSPVVAD